MIFGFDQMSNKECRKLAVIPARGGSKRLLGKALIEFQGKPLLGHTILAAIESDRFNKIVVSSDSSDILDVASTFGAIAHKRSNSLARDETPTAPVLIDLLEQDASKGTNWDVLACLYATAPLRTAHDIRAVVDLLETDDCDFAMAVCEADRPVHQSLTLDDSGTLNSVWPEMVNLNSQDAPTYLFGNGSTYAVNVPAFIKNKSLYGPRLKGYAMPRERSVDINTQEDLDLLHYYARRQTGDTK